MPSVTIEGRSLYFEDVGAGRPVLLLHGFPFTSETFWPQLERPPQDARLIAVDHRGFGRSAPVAGPITMEALAADALALLDALGITTAVVGGVSMGGYAALALARLAPARVSALVLIDTQMGADDDAGRARREATALDVEANGAGVIAEAMLPKLLAPQTPEDIRRRVDGIIRAQAPATIAAASRGLALRRDQSELLARFTGPCLIVVGAVDVLTPPAKAMAMAALARAAQLEILEDAGHLSNLEQPADFRLALERFLASVDQPRPTAGS